MIVRKQNKAQGIFLLWTLFFLAVSACGGASGGGSGATTQASLSGTVMGGTTGIQGSTVTLYAAGTGSPTQLGSAKTAADGSFTVAYIIPPTGTIIYAQALGGVIGANSNPLIHMISVVGVAGSTGLPSSLTINEVSSVATGQAFYEFVNFSGTISGSLSNLSTATATLQHLVNTRAGTIILTGSAATTLEEHANLLGSCLNDTALCVSEASTLGINGPSPDSFSILHKFQGAVQNGTLTTGQTTSINGYLSQSASFDPFPSAPTTLSGTILEVTYCVSGSGCNFNSSSNAFASPAGVAVDASGTIWITNYSNGTVQAIPSGQTSANPPIHVGASPTGIAVDGYGNVWVANAGSGSISEIRAGLTSANSPISVGSFPESITVDGSNNIWVANVTSGTVQEIIAGQTSAQSPITVGGYPNAIAADGFNNI